jgi:hypothetical protein
MIVATAKKDCSMNERETLLKEMTRDYGLQEQDIYLLDLIPLIEMIWADGQRQQEEVALLYDFALQHLQRLSAWCDGVRVVSSEDVIRFVNYFLTERPSPALLKRLREFVVASLRQSVSCREAESRRQEIISWCLDIAASAMTSEAEVRSKIDQQEKVLLIKLMQSLKLSPENEV